MGIPRERQVFIGLGVAAVAGLMFDKVVLSPTAAIASEAPATASVAPAPALASAAAGKLQVGLRDALRRAFEDYAGEQMPGLSFGPDEKWLVAPDRPVAPTASTEAVEAPSLSVLPGLNVRPTLTLVMPTSRGGLAVIDGKNMSVGEVHPDGYTLVAVDARSVTIGYNGATAVLNLPTPASQR